MIGGGREPFSVDGFFSDTAWASGLVRESVEQGNQRGVRRISMDFVRRKPLSPPGTHQVLKKFLVPGLWEVVHWIRQNTQAARSLSRTLSGKNALEHGPFATPHRIVHETGRTLHPAECPPQPISDRPHEARLTLA